MSPFIHAADESAKLERLPATQKCQRSTSDDLYANGGPKQLESLQPIVIKWVTVCIVIEKETARSAVRCHFGRLGTQLTLAFGQKNVYTFLTR